MVTLNFRDRSLILDTFPKLMGILNVTPDSFSDGGSTVPLDERIGKLIADGASIIDIGGESTRPGALSVPLDEELSRVLPAVEAVRKANPKIFISIDTRKAKVAEECLKLGADIINDVSGGFTYDPELGTVAANYHCGVIVMHSRSTPDQMQTEENLIYKNGIDTVVEEMRRIVERVQSFGIQNDSIILDPGIGFAKTPELSMNLIYNAGKFLELGYPLLSAPSRKAFIGKLTGEKIPANRDYGTCGAVLASATKEYRIIRVHNVKAAMDSLKVYYACMGAIDLIQE